MYNITSSTDTVTCNELPKTSTKYAKQQCHMCRKCISATNVKKHRTVHNKNVGNVHVINDYFQFKKNELKEII